MKKTYEEDSLMQRSIVVCILLTIVTCGFYSIYWMIKLNDELNDVAGKPEATSGGMVFLFTLITCGIYGYYWYYKMGENVDAVKTSKGLASSNTGIIYLVLGLFGFGIVNYCLMQDTLNKSVVA